MKYLQSDDPHHKESPQAYSEWMQARVQTILHSNDTTNFFLHEHDSKVRVPHHISVKLLIPRCLTQGGVVRWFGNNIFEDFYVDFWYTSNASPISKFRNTYTIVPLHGYAITGAAVSCLSILIAITEFSPY